MDGRDPLLDAWRRAMARRSRPLQIPGHKNRYAGEGDVLGGDLLRELVRDDIPLQGGVDDNAFSNQYLEQAEAMWAVAVGADHSRFLVGGSTQGNVAALCSITRPDRPVAVDRTSHRSVHAALVISGALPRWIYPELHPEFGLPIGIPRSALTDLGGATGLFVTSPSYVGSLTDVSALAQLAHHARIPLVVDQAWGAHLGFMSGHGAIAQGADVSVTSVHKALMGYSQTAVVTIRSDLVQIGELDRCVDLTATTSPSGTLLASIDATRAVIERDGEAAIGRTVEVVAAMRRRLATVQGLVVLDEENSGTQIDPFKITLWLPRTGASGLDVGSRLWDSGNGPESADRDTVVLSVSLLDEPDFIDDVTGRLIGLIEELRTTPRKPVSADVWSVEPEVVITPRQAFFAARRRLNLTDSVGEVSAEQFCPYPPGIPLVAPGERITEQSVAAILAAGRVGRVAYCSDPSLKTVEVVDAI